MHEVAAVSDEELEPPIVVGYWLWDGVCVRGVAGVSGLVSLKSRKRCKELIRLLEQVEERLPE